MPQQLQEQFRQAYVSSLLSALVLVQLHCLVRDAKFGLAKDGLRTRSGTSAERFCGDHYRLSNAMQRGKIYRRHRAFSEAQRTQVPADVK